MVYGAAMGSFAVESFGIRGFEGVGAEDVLRRVRAFQDLTHVVRGGCRVSRAGESRRYEEAGVDLVGAEAARTAHRASWWPVPGRALSVGKIGAFGGMVRVPAGMRRNRYSCSVPSGVGTKVLVARTRPGGSIPSVKISSTTASTTSWSHGAAPIAFMDYIAGAALDGRPDRRDRRSGVARGCRSARDGLAGGETAQMPGLYQPGTFDLAGHDHRCGRRGRAIHGDHVQPGDVLLGTLRPVCIRTATRWRCRIVFDHMGLDVEDDWPDSPGSVADALLAVHRSYWRAVQPVFDRVHALAHITGGGIWR